MKKSIAVAAILMLASFIRLWHLDSFPQSLSIDEASIGYNAWSILETLRDEFGVYMPLSFRSFGDYKPPMNIYLTSISIALFELDELSVRLPVALTSVLLIAVSILLLKKLKFSSNAALISGLWLTLLGWNIFYSRASFEAISALFLTLLGFYWYLVWRQKRTAFSLLGAATVWGLSIWTYHSQRVFIPLLVLFLLMIDKKILLKDKRVYISALVLISFFVALFVLLYFDRSALGRASNLFLTQDPVISKQLNHNIFDTFTISKKIFEQYLHYFSLKFWFWKSGIITPAGYQGIGLLNLVDLPVFVLGIYSLFKSKNIFLRKLVIFWFLAGPVAAAFTRGDPSPIRTIVWMPFFVFVMASGFEILLTKRRIWLIAYLVGLAFCFGYFVDLYTRNFTKFYADQWHFGYKQVLIYACNNYKKYDRIIVTDKYGIIENRIKTVPYIYALIYCHIDPKNYLVSKEIYNIEFRQPQWSYDAELKNTLLIGSRWDFPENFPPQWVDQTIYFPTGEKAFLIVETSSEKSKVIQ